METKIYGDDIGRKFNIDKSPRLIPGNTFISMVESGSEIFSHIIYIRNLISGSEFGSKYIFLPPDSYHMTVIEGVIPEFKDMLWTTHLPSDCDLTSVNQYFYEQYAKIEPMQNVNMRPDYIQFSPSGCSIQLLPNSEKDAEILKRVRDAVAEHCGLDDANHDSYGFHITIAYLWKRLNEDELMELNEVIRSVNEYLTDKVRPFSMPPARLVSFDTMMSFQPVKN